MTGKNKQLAINMVSSFMTFMVGLAINFFLTPFIVKHLGADAYGFVNLSNNIIGYTTLLTVALNAMAGRFIALSYQKGEFTEANKYFSSVFFSNLIMAGVITIVMIGCVVWLEYIIDVPDRILSDVKMLFILLAASNILALTMSVYGVATYIKNRLELASVRSIVSSVIRCIVLIVAFGFFAPHVWYVGASGLLCGLYVIFTNKQLTKRLTPELIISRGNFHWKKVKELISSGVWNLLVRLGVILGVGFDLLFANVFLGATPMGILSISKALPTTIKAMFQGFGGSFGPMQLQLYASRNMEELISEFKKSIRIFTLLTCIPLSVIYVYGEEFYHLWLPEQDAHWLYILTLLGTPCLVIGLPLEGLWNIFTITNKVRIASIAEIANYGTTFLIMFVCMFFVESIDNRLLVLAGARNLCSFIQAWTFLPMGTAYCMGLKKTEFYPVTFKSFICVLLTCSLGFLMKPFIIVDSWFMMCIAAIILTIVSIVTNIIIILHPSDREFLKKKIAKFIGV